MKTLLVVDYGVVHTRAYFANRPLQYHGKPTGALYGVLKLLTGVIERHKPCEIIVAQDSPPYKRTFIAPQYKADRAPLEKDEMMRMAESKAITLKALLEYGAVCWRVPGMEADDLVARCAQHFGLFRNAPHFDRVVILSSDSDLYQCLNERTYMLRKGASSVLYGMNDFKREHDGVEPRDWPFVLCLAGTHNGLKGVKGIGPKTAIKLLKSGIDDPKWKQEYNDVIYATYKVVSLPHDDCPDPVMPLVERDIPPTSVKLEQYLKEYNMKWIPSMDDAWSAWRMQRQTQR